MKETLFTVGPVEMHAETLHTGGLQLPYFRTPEFSELTLACEADLLALAKAPKGSRVLFLTCSGTGAMEASLINLLGGAERALLVRGGSFGERFGHICDDVDIGFDAIDLEPGHSLPAGGIAGRLSARHGALLVNAHETSTGVAYDLFELGAASTASGALFIVDAISAFLCDPIDMEAMGIDVLILSSQKALALAPGLAMVLLSPRAQQKAAAIKPKAHYFSFAPYLKDGLRGQTPFTPAVGTILQLRTRLDSLGSLSADELVRETGELARHFREAVRGAPFAPFADRPSNALTALSPTDGRSAFSVFEALKRDHGLVVTPNGGALRDRVFRVGHMGNIHNADLDRLASALHGRLR